MVKLCRYCNEPMKEVTVTEYTNPIPKDGSHPPIPAYHCENPLCDIQPFLFRCEPKPCKMPSADPIHLGFHGPLVARKWYCPFCDNPVEILDVVNHVWNCPTCSNVAMCGVTFRYYLIIDGHADWEHELVEERDCGTCWDPLASDEDEDEEDDE